MQCVVLIKSTGTVGLCEYKHHQEHQVVEVPTAHTVVSHDLKILIDPKVEKYAIHTPNSEQQIAIHGGVFNLIEYCVVRFGLNTTYVIRSEERARIRVALKTAGYIVASTIYAPPSRVGDILSSPSITVASTYGMTASKVPWLKPTGLAIIDGTINVDTRSDDHRTTIEHFDNGSRVVVDGYAGGAHLSGLLGHIDLTFIAPDGSEMPRRYYAADVSKRAIGEFAKLASDYGTDRLTAVDIGNELADARFVIENVGKVYEHVTGGMLSKAFYHADTVIGYADDHMSARVTEELHERFAAWLQEAHDNDTSVAQIAAKEWDGKGPPPYAEFLMFDQASVFKVDFENRNVELREDMSVSDAVGHVWETIDQFLTNNDGSPGGWLIKDFADGWFWTPHRITAVAAVTEGHAVHPVNRNPAATGHVHSVPAVGVPGCRDEGCPHHGTEHGHVEQPAAIIWRGDLSCALITFNANDAQYPGTPPGKVCGVSEEIKALIEVWHGDELPPTVFTSSQQSLPNRPARPKKIVLTFENGPSHDGARFVEANDEHGNSVNVGEWSQSDDGMWHLTIQTDAV